MWNNEKELNFLELYQSEPVLWEPTHKYHKDKQKIYDAWIRISEQTGFSVPELKKKRDSLMATFRGHLRRMKKSQLTGSGSEEIYKPIWFAFDLMNSFLGHIYDCKKTTNTENQDAHSMDEESCGGGSSGIHEDSDENTAEDPTNATNMVCVTSASPATKRRRQNPPELQRAEKDMKDAMSALNRVLSRKEVPEDDCDRYGKILANKLRQLPEFERLQMMYEIDGLFIRRIQRHHTTVSSSLPFVKQNYVPFPVPSPTYRRPNSSWSLASEPSISDSMNPSRPTHSSLSSQIPVNFKTPYSPILRVQDLHEDNRTAHSPTITRKTYLPSQQFPLSNSNTVLCSENVTPNASQYGTVPEDILKHRFHDTMQ